MNRFPEKPKNTLHPVISARVFTLAVVMLLSGLLIGGMAMFLVAPTLYNIPTTQAYLATDRARLDAQAQALAATAVDLSSLATRNAQSLLATQNAQSNNAQQTAIALQNAQTLLQQTATQSQFNVLATQTGAAVLNAQQLTRIALDYAATQVALNQNATQVQLNFDATRAALGGTQSGQSLAPLTMPTHTPAPTLVPPATATQGIAFTDTFSDLSSTRYRYSTREAFALVPEGLRVEATGWLLTRDYVDGAWTFEAVFQPALVTNAQYDVLLNVAVNEGYLVRVDANALNAKTVTLTRFSGGLPPTTLAPALRSAGVDVVLVGESRLAVQYANNTLVVTLNGTKILESGVTLASAGAIGLQLPQGTVVKSLTLTIP